jgi:hypothetical protein
MKLNIEKLNEWLAIQGPHAREALSYKSGLGFYTIGRLLRSDKQITKAQAMAIAHATGLSINDLVYEESKNIA